MADIMRSARRTRRATARERILAAQAEAATQPEMPPLDHFHLFLKLPIELQLMIWTIWRQDQLVLRHYMSLFYDTRFYAALDPSTKKFVRTAARSAASEQDGPLDPMEHKIRFTNEIQSILGQHTSPLSIVLRAHPFPQGGLEAQSGLGCHHLKPAFAWVNFEKDIFSIENISYRFGGRFRFLMHNIGVKVPKPMAPNHWASRIQILTLQTECRPVVIEDAHRQALNWFSMGDRYGRYSPPASLMDIDDQVLQMMASLKRILLVIQRFKLCSVTRRLLDSAEKTLGGYLEYSALEAAHKEAYSDAVIKFGAKC